MAMTRKGIKTKKGALKYPSKKRMGHMAKEPQVPGAFGKKPTPKKDKKTTSGYVRLGAFFSFIDPSYNA